MSLAESSGLVRDPVSPSLLGILFLVVPLLSRSETSITRNVNDEVQTRIGVGMTKAETFQAPPSAEEGVFRLKAPVCFSPCGFCLRSESRVVVCYCISTLTTH